ncbi:MAG: Sir2 family NAD-dependent protein deacetylase [Anaerolineae bacterium]|nr:Sir2 family NAD-dependent protein deacetylase [Anaerolineae bacterium]
MRYGEHSIDEAVRIIAEARHLIAFTGAGISTDSGIPDFRSPECGLWNNTDPMKVASLYGFRQNPQDFYDWVHPLVKLTIAAQPNNAHMVLAQLERYGYLKGIITQNIDMLHTRAGSQVVYELHGHFREATCTCCFKRYPAEPIIHRFMDDGLVPTCPACDGVLKPNVILFGEQLPAQTFMDARDAMAKADAVLVVGSSLEVAPAGDLPMQAARRGARLIIINLQPTEADHLATMIIRGDASTVLSGMIQQLQLPL